MFRKYRICCRRNESSLEDNIQSVNSNHSSKNNSKLNPESNLLISPSNNHGSNNLKSKCVNINDADLCNDDIELELNNQKSNLNNDATKVIVNNVTQLDSNDLEKNNSLDSNSEIKLKVTNAWKIITNQCETFENDKTNKVKNSEKTAWKSVRVFVSSTFTDMYSEREILVKKVFPELREWCEQRKLILIECDLRWGVPKDSSTSSTICTCLEEIDRCIEENEGKPFFINMLSERYGWVPVEAEVPQDIKEKYLWVPNVSITHMEILHGAYRIKNENALFCLRNPSFVADLPENKLPKFVDVDELCVLQLKFLKENLIKKFQNQYFDYNCSVSGIDLSTGMEKVNLIGLEHFAEQILNFLKLRIDATYPNNQQMEDLTLNQEDELSHKSIMEVKSNFVIGREVEIEMILNYFYNDVVHNEMKTLGPMDNSDDEEKENWKKKLLEDIEKFQVSESDARTFCLYGISGIGKSTLLASIARKLKSEGYDVLYHCVSSSYRSISSLNFIKRLLSHINITYTEEDENRENLMIQAVNKLKSNELKLFIIIDGMDEFEDCEWANSFSWLPPRFGPNVRTLIGLNSEHYICNCRMSDRDSYFFKLRELSSASSEAFINAYLNRFNKRLDVDQMTELMNHESFGLPLWLNIVCEELRMFGEFSTVTKTIKEYPDPLDQLAIYVLKRLLREDETQLLEKTLCLIHCSHSGIPENEMNILLGDIDKKVEAPMATWSALRRYLKPMLKITKFDRTVKISMNHLLFNKAIKELLLTDDATTVKWHTYLADFYQHYSHNKAYVFEDLPHNLLQAKLYKRLVEFLRHDIRAMNLGRQKSQIYEKMRCTNFVFKNPGFDCDATICNLCSMRSNIISMSSFQTKDLCFICGEWVPSNLGGESASFCMDHRVFAAPNWSQCHFCSSKMPSNQMVKMKLCNSCGWKKSCCHLKLE